MPKGARYLGRRPAFPQWCENPIEGRRIAVGDAAFAYDPLAGQGIRFALASAFAAASVIQDWKENGDHGAANRFYRDFVGQARVRHLEFLAKLELDLPADVLESLAEQRSLLRKHRLRRVKHRQPHRHRSRDYPLGQECSPLARGRGSFTICGSCRKICVLGCVNNLLNISRSRCRTSPCCAFLVHSQRCIESNYLMKMALRVRHFSYIES